jgi:hypothetical protein
MMRGISPNAVEWKDGKAYPAGPNAGSFDPLLLAEIALKSGWTGGPITAKASVNAQAVGPQLCDAYLRPRFRGATRVLSLELP